MRKQTFSKLRKTIGILLAVFLVVTLTAVAASANHGNGGCGGSNGCGC